MLNNSAHGVPTEKWTAAKDEATAIMIERAKVRGMIPYSDLVSEMSSLRLQAHDPRLFHLLGEISRDENSAGRGMLTVIVVHKVGDMQPGPGFFELAKSLGRDTEDILGCWIAELKHVHAYWYKQRT